MFENFLLLAFEEGENYLFEQFYPCHLISVIGALLFVPRFNVKSRNLATEVVVLLIVCSQPQRHAHSKLRLTQRPTLDTIATKEVKPRSWSCQFNIPQAPSCGAEDGAIVALLAGIAASSIIDVKHDDVLTVIPETIIGRYCS